MVRKAYRLGALVEEVAEAAGTDGTEALLIAAPLNDGPLGMLMARETLLGGKHGDRVFLEYFFPSQGLGSSPIYERHVDRAVKLSAVKPVALSFQDPAGSDTIGTVRQLSPQTSQNHMLASTLRINEVVFPRMGRELQTIQNRPTGMTLDLGYLQDYQNLCRQRP
ncbi:MAG: hypothetical protein ACYDBQ_08590 [Thermoplasmatota archaeon]